jgi:hypothetical protein
MNTKQLLTTSSYKCYHRCPREYYHAVEQGMQSVGVSKALLWGRVWDAIMAYLWAPESLWQADIALGVGMLGDAWDQLDEVDQINTEVLTVGYVERWRDAHLSIGRIGVKLKFDAPLINPESKRASKLWYLAGELDGIAMVDGKCMIIEHKSSSEDLSPDSTYWRILRLDPQCSNYFQGARRLGYEPVGVLYDVVRKPAIKRLLATPEEARRYKKDGTLYAAQRDYDETIEEYQARLIEDVATRPEWYYHRGEVVRLESEEIEAQYDALDTSHVIHQCQIGGRWPRSGACRHYNRLCQFFPVCTGESTIDDETKYVYVGAHPELRGKT